MASAARSKWLVHRNQPSRTESCWLQSSDILSIRLTLRNPVSFSLRDKARRPAHTEAIVTRKGGILLRKSSRTDTVEVDATVGISGAVSQQNLSIERRSRTRGRGCSRFERISSCGVHKCRAELFALEVAGVSRGSSVGVAAYLW